MSQNKEGTEKKPGVKIQDLSPKKDAKGGATRNPNAVDPNKAGIEANKMGNPDAVNPD